MTLLDSGYTEEQIADILDELAAGVDLEGEQWLMVKLELGLSEGDVLQLSDNDTVLLSESREVIDARLARVRAALATGTPLLEVLHLAV